MSDASSDAVDFPIRRKLTLIYADVDTAGHVNNVAIARYFQEARVLLFDAIRAALPAKERLLVHLRRVEIDYLEEVLYPGEIEIGIRVETIGRTSCRTRSALFHRGVCSAQARSVDVAIDAGTGRPTPFTDPERRTLAAFHGAGTQE